MNPTRPGAGWIEVIAGPVRVRGQQQAARLRRKQRQHAIDVGERQGVCGHDCKCADASGACECWGRR